MKTLRTRLLLLIPLVCLLLLTVQQFVPSLYTSLLGRIDPATNTYCVDRCGPKESIFDTIEEGTSYGESTVTMSEVDPPAPWFRTGFDSSVTTPPYLLVLCLILLFCSWFFWHYLQWLRRPRIDPSGYVLPPRFPSSFMRQKTCLLTRFENNSLTLMHNCRCPYDAGPRDGNRMVRPDCVPISC